MIQRMLISGIIMCPLFSAGFCSEHLLHTDVKLVQEKQPLLQFNNPNLRANSVRHIHVSVEGIHRQDFVWAATFWGGQIAVGQGGEEACVLYTIVSPNDSEWNHGAIDGVLVSPAGKFVAVREDDGRFCILRYGDGNLIGTQYWLPAICTTDEDPLSHGLRVRGWSWLSSPERLVLNYEDGTVLSFSPNSGMATELLSSKWNWELLPNYDPASNGTGQRNRYFTTFSQHLGERLRLGDGTIIKTPELLASADDRFIVDTGTRTELWQPIAQTVRSFRSARAMAIDAESVLVLSSTHRELQLVSTSNQATVRSWKCDVNWDDLGEILDTASIHGSVFVLLYNATTEVATVVALEEQAPNAVAHFVPVASKGSRYSSSGFLSHDGRAVHWMNVVAENDRFRIIWRQEMSGIQ